MAVLLVQAPNQILAKPSAHQRSAMSARPNERRFVENPSSAGGLTIDFSEGTARAKRQ